MHNSEFSQRDEVRTGVVLGGSQVVDGSRREDRMRVGGCRMQALTREGRTCVQASLSSGPGHSHPGCPGTVSEEACAWRKASERVGTRDPPSTNRL